MVGNGSCAPMEHNGCVSDGEKVRARVVDLNGIPVLQQSHCEVVWREGQEEQVGEGRGKWEGREDESQ